MNKLEQNMPKKIEEDVSHKKTEHAKLHAQFINKQDGKEPEKVEPTKLTEDSFNLLDREESSTSKKLKTSSKNLKETSEHSQIDADYPREKTESEILKELREEFLREEVGRFEDVIKFLEGFEEIIQEKRQIVKEEKGIQVSGEDAQTQYNKNDLLGKEFKRKRTKNPNKRYPLTEKFKKNWMIPLLADRKNRHEYAKKIIESQEETINVIRRKISEQYERYICHKMERDNLKEEIRQKVVKDLEKYNIESRYFNSKSKVVDKILALQKVKYSWRSSRKNRMVNIMRKMVLEEQRQLQINRQQVRTYTYKVKRKERIIKNMEVVGTAKPIIEHLPIEPSIIIEEPPIECEALPEPEEILESPKKKNKDGKNNKDGKKEKDKKKKEKSKKGTEKKKEKINKKEKKEKNIEPEKDLFELPYVPITNERIIMKPVENQRLDSMLQDIENLEDTIQKQKELYQHVDERKKFKDDKHFITNFSELVFKNYKNGVVYTKWFGILNQSNEPKKLKFYKCFYQEDFDVNPYLLQVSPTDIHVIHAGLSLKMCIKFSPIKLEGIIRGELMFLTKKINSNQINKLLLPFLCVPICEFFDILPKAIIFEKAPIWKYKNDEFSKTNYKTIKIINSSEKNVNVTISKQRDPLELNEEYLEMCEEIPNFYEKSQDQFFHNVTPEIPPNSEASSSNQLLQYLLEQVVNDQVIEYMQSQECLERYKKSGLLATLKVLQECMEGVFYVFVIENNNFVLEPWSEKTIKVVFKNADYVGHYLEKYNVKFISHEGDAPELLGMMELPIQAETTGKFIHTDPEVLDFNICTFNSVYQMQFDIINADNIPHNVIIKWPSTLGNYLQCISHTAYVQPDEKTTVNIKFIPRKDIETDEISYYNNETAILNFPLQIHVNSRDFYDVPPTKVNTFAILTSPNGLKLKPLNMDNVSIFKNMYEIKMGDCSTRETVYADVELFNSSYAVQHYGFLDLPEFLTITPNFGFGEIFPLESKTLRIYFSPKKEDIQNYLIQGEHANHEVAFNISVVTIKSLGGLKKPMNCRALKRSMLEMEQQLDTPTSSLQEEILNCMKMIKVENLYVKAFNDGYENEIKEENVECGLQIQNIDIQLSDIKPCNKIVINAKIIDPLCDFSHQYVEFPDTPCGSYSIMDLKLRALKHFHDFDCVCGYMESVTKVRKQINFVAGFEIYGDEPQIKIQPTSGYIKCGESIKLTVIAQPELAKELVEEKARALKREQMVEDKKRELLRTREEQLEAKLLMEIKSKEKKKKKGKSASDHGSKTEKKGKMGKGKKLVVSEDTEPSETKPEPLPEIIINDEDVVISYLDYYPAEMSLWKCLEPYIIRAKFTCVLTYISPDILKKEDQLYFTAVCKVVRPDFIHSHNLQHISFGPTAIGTSPRQIITLQNIQYKSIKPKLKYFSPLQQFTGPLNMDIELEPEYQQLLPFTFKPHKEGHVRGYFEIKTKWTTYVMIISGEGVAPEIIFNPDFLVCRLEAKPGDSSDCVFEVSNKCKALLPLKLVKICELDGEIKPKPIEFKEKPDNKKDPKKGKDKSTKNDNKPKGKNSKSTKGEKEKKYTMTKFSNELTVDEIYSIENFFHVKEGVSYFEEVFEKQDSFTVEPFSKTTVRVRFGVPLTEEEKEALKAAKGKKGKKEKKNKGSSNKKGKASPKTNANNKELFYIAKYNIMLGEKTFIKDFILIARFTK